MFYVAYIHFVFRGLDVTLCLVLLWFERGVWKGDEWRLAGVQRFEMHFPYIVWYPGVLSLLLFCEAAMAVFCFTKTPRRD